MRPPRVRSTVRGIMVAVAVVALVLGGVPSRRLYFAARDLYAQAATYSGAAIYFAQEERKKRSIAEAWQKGEDEFQRKTGSLLPSPSFHHTLTSLWEADRCARLAGHCSRMRAKYARRLFPLAPGRARSAPAQLNGSGRA